MPLPQIALPVSGYKSHISIDWRLGLIRQAAVTSVTDADGRQLRCLASKDNTAGDVWADSAYRSESNEKWLVRNVMTSRIHRRKPAGKLMPERTAKANVRKSSVRAAVEHVFGHQKNRFGLFIRTIDIARAEAKLTLANLAFNFDRLIFHKRRPAPGADPHQDRCARNRAQELKRSAETPKLLPSAAKTVSNDQKAPKTPSISLNQTGSCGCPAVGADPDPTVQKARQNQSTAQHIVLSSAPPEIIILID